ncbi:hypothetical protein HK100_001471 [Physocladia obscura]|uniref:Uncharacterized protein n=1 Tax=Physocladia obscura TaxID=109957 RepID=A0AAD5SYS7_9FUNG|nr:hypothetical protein HK100_001471 [Physocladia obscura]
MDIRMIETHLRQPTRETHRAVSEFMANQPLAAELCAPLLVNLAMPLNSNPISNNSGFTSSTFNANQNPLMQNTSSDALLAWFALCVYENLATPKNFSAQTAATRLAAKNTLWALLPIAALPSPVKTKLYSTIARMAVVMFHAREWNIFDAVRVAIHHGDSTAHELRLALWKHIADVFVTSNPRVSDVDENLRIELENVQQECLAILGIDSLAFSPSSLSLSSSRMPSLGISPIHPDDALHHQSIFRCYDYHQRQQQIRSQSTSPQNVIRIINDPSQSTSLILSLQTLQFLNPPTNFATLHPAIPFVFSAYAVECRLLAVSTESLICLAESCAARTRIVVAAVDSTATDSTKNDFVMSLSAGVVGALRRATTSPAAATGEGGWYAVDDVYLSKLTYLVSLYARNHIGRIINTVEDSYATAVAARNSNGVLIAFANGVGNNGATTTMAQAEVLDEFLQLMRM